MLVVVRIVKASRSGQELFKNLQSANDSARSKLGFKDKLVNITIQPCLPINSQGSRSKNHGSDSRYFSSIYSARSSTQRNIRYRIAALGFIYDYKVAPEIKLSGSKLNPDTASACKCTTTAANTGSWFLVLQKLLAAKLQSSVYKSVYLRSSVHFSPTGKSGSYSLDSN